MYGISPYRLCAALHGCAGNPYAFSGGGAGTKP